MALDGGIIKKNKKITKLRKNNSNERILLIGIVSWSPISLFLIQNKIILRKVKIPLFQIGKKISSTTSFIVGSFPVCFVRFVKLLFVSCCKLDSLKSFVEKFRIFVKLSSIIFFNSLFNPCVNPTSFGEIKTQLRKNLIANCYVFVCCFCLFVCLFVCCLFLFCYSCWLIYIPLDFQQILKHNPMRVFSFDRTSILV